MKTADGKLIPIEVESGVSSDPGLANEPSNSHFLILSHTKVSSRTHTGPMPAPETMAAYDQIVPGSAARLIDEHIADKRHYRAIVEQQVRSENQGVARGQWIGFATMATAILGAILMGILGHAVLAAAFLSPAVMMAVSRFHAREGAAKSDDDDDDDDEDGAHDSEGSIETHLAARRGLL